MLQIFCLTFNCQNFPPENIWEFNTHGEFLSHTVCTCAVKVIIYKSCSEPFLTACLSKAVLGIALLSATLSWGTYINDVRQFLTIFDPPSPLTSDFYLLMSDFLGSFQTPPPSPPKIGHHLCTFPNIKLTVKISSKFMAF